MDSMTQMAVIEFAIGVALCGAAYVLATITAKFISPVPRHVYVGRLVFLAFFGLLIWVFWFVPEIGHAWSGPRERYLQQLPIWELKTFSVILGTSTIWVWALIALWKRPRKYERERSGNG